MPQKMTVTAPDGRTLDIEGDRIPTEAELTEIFAAKPPSFSAGNETDPAGHAVARDSPGLWERLNTPLVPQIATAAKALADHLDAPRMGDQELNDRIPGMGTLSAQLRGLHAGLIEGGGNVITGLTSPLGIAMSLLGMGEESAAVKYVPALKGLLKSPAVQALQRWGLGAASAGFAGHGAGEVLEGASAGDLARVGRGVAEGAGGLAGVAAAVRPRAVPGQAPARGALTPQELDANAFAEREGVPLDVATATGSRWARAAQKMVGHSLGGENAATEMLGSQHEALTAAGEKIAGQISPGPVSPEQAGAAVPASLRQAMSDISKQARAKYGEVADIEADPAHAADVPRQSSMTALDRQQMEGRQEHSLGYVPTAKELEALRGIHAEMDSLPFVKRTWNDRSADVGKRGNAAGGDAEIVGGAAGASVYDDILAHMTEAKYVPTRNDVTRQINGALETGHFTSAAKAAFEVAQKRLVGDSSISRPELPPDAGRLGVPMQSMAMPVELAPVKEAMQPIFQELSRQNAVSPLMGSKANALRTLDRIVNGPDHVPASVADAVRSDLLKVARVDIPELRDRGQGIAAKAAGELGKAIDEISTQVPGHAEALAEGRAATRAKYEVADVLKQVAKKGDGGVDVYRRLTAPKDAEIELLRRVQEIAPESVPKIGRAKLEEWLDRAGERGRFDHPDALYAEWQRLGDGTKDILFGKAAKDLDDFFLLAKRIGENPNTSGTAPTAAAFKLWSNLAALPLSKVLYSPAGAKAAAALARADLRVSSGAARSAATEAAWATLAGAAKQQGVTLPAYPRAAQTDSEEKRPK
jgi:hypothetical protein